jgi:hypothetical protein
MVTVTDPGDFVPVGKLKAGGRVYHFHCPGAMFDNAIGKSTPLGTENWLAMFKELL